MSPSNQTIQKSKSVGCHFFNNIKKSQLTPYPFLIGPIIFHVLLSFLLFKTSCFVLPSCQLQGVMFMSTTLGVKSCEFQFQLEVSCITGLSGIHNIGLKVERVISHALPIPSGIVPKHFKTIKDSPPPKKTS